MAIDSVLYKAIAGVTVVVNAVLLFQFLDVPQSRSCVDNQPRLDLVALTYAIQDLRLAAGQSKLLRARKGSKSDEGIPARIPANLFD